MNGHASQCIHAFDDCPKGSDVCICGYDDLDYSEEASDE
jgi:hypothetical protein